MREIENTIDDVEQMCAGIMYISSVFRIAFPFDIVEFDDFGKPMMALRGARNSGPCSKEYAFCTIGHLCFQHRHSQPCSLFRPPLRLEQHEPGYRRSSRMPS
jgi:hypothetical protein